MSRFATGLLIYGIMCAYAAILFSSGFLIKNSNSSDTLIPPFDHSKLSYIAVVSKTNKKTGNSLQTLSAIFFFDGCICLATATATGKPFTILSAFLLLSGIISFIWALVNISKKYVAYA
jgi:hypothetical protein